jgi:transcriptional regulator with XRE-family HTH domain
MSESLLSKSGLVQKLLKSKKFRDSYVYEHVRNGIPFQIRATRNLRDWTQAQLGKAAKKPRPVISRLEDPNYGKLTLKTLFEIASAFDMALLVKFVPFSRLINEYEDVSSSALAVKPITDSEEVAKLEAWALGPSVNVLAGDQRTVTAQQLRALDQPVSTSAAQQTLVFSSPELVTQADDSTSNQPMIQPQARAAAA